MNRRTWMMIAAVLVMCCTVSGDVQVKRYRQRVRLIDGKIVERIVERRVSSCDRWGVTRETNRIRSRAGLPNLRCDAELQTAAQRHAEWMAANESLTHANIRSGGENIATGQRTADEVVRDWYRSPGHRANMMSRTWSRIGIGRAVSVRGRIYWVQRFR